jgi:hypothetical protein
MEGMRQQDERRLQEISNQSAINLTENQIEHDGRVENGLIIMLSNLEHSHSILLERSVKDWPQLVVNTLTDMVATVDKYLDAAPVPIDKVGRSDYVALDLAGTNGQPPKSYRDSTQTLKDQLPTQDEVANPPQTQEDFDAFNGRMLDLLQGYLCLFSHHYYSPIAADQWIEASKIFATELRQTLTDLSGHR